MVSIEADRFRVGRLMMDIYYIYMCIIILTVLDFNDSNCIISTFYHQSVLSTLISNYLYMPQLEYIYKTYDWDFSYESNAFPGFDFDLDEVWAPLNPHLKHVTKGSPSKDEICHCLVLTFLLNSPAVGSKDKICHFVFVFDTKTDIYQIFSLSISLRAP